MSIENRLHQLKDDLEHPSGPSISTNKNYPFALFHYAPEDEFKMRESLKQLLSDLRNKGWNICNVDLFNSFIEFLEVQEGGVLIEALIEEEKMQFQSHKNDIAKPLDALKNTFDLYFKDEKEFPQFIHQKISKITESTSDSKTVIFLSRIGGLYPFYRTSSLLRFLDNGITTPTIVLYPGERTEQHYLKFMGIMDADRDYRPRVY